MSILKKDEISKSYYYFPHPGTVKKYLNGFKMRVVFNTSAVTLNDKSVNNLMMDSPVIQNNLVSILIKFRYVISYRSFMFQSTTSLWRITQRRPFKPTRHNSGPLSKSWSSSMWQI